VELIHYGFRDDMSKTSSKSNTITKSISADDILADLMSDLKDVDKTMIGFDPQNSSVDSSDLELTSMTNSGAPDNLDLSELKDDQHFDEPLSVGLTSMQGEDSHVTLLASDSVSLNLPDDSNKKVESEVSSLFKSDDQVNDNLVVINQDSQSDLQAIELNELSDQQEASFKTSIFLENNKQGDIVHSDDKTQVEVASHVEQKTKAYSSEIGLPNESERTIALDDHHINENINVLNGDSEKTLAVAGFNQLRQDESLQEKIKISVGQTRGNASSSGYASWGTADANLAQAENLRIAQEKILELERENEKLRSQNEDLISASEIVKERADLLNGQLYEFKNDQDSLEQSFKNELAILKKQLERKDTELAKVSSRADELDSKIKFDLKKIRVRERELENRLELMRAEKNALVKAKDEQILDLKRKLDQVQLEVESYRQKCVDLNKVIETNQDSFKRTIRALRLAMANLELQDDNKVPLKKAE